MPVEFLTDEQAAAYGRYTGPVPRADLDRYFFLDDADRALITPKRREANRLGYAVQLCTVRYLGAFLPDLSQVPEEAVVYLAEQLAVADPACLSEYAARDKTRLEHAWEIRSEYGFVDFSELPDRAGRVAAGPGVDHHGRTQSPLRRRECVAAPAWGTPSGGRRAGPAGGPGP